VAYRVGDQLAYALVHYADFVPSQHFNSHSDQSQSLFAVFDYGSSGNGIEFGIGRGLTRATDSCVLKLMLLRNVGSPPPSIRQKVRPLHPKLFTNQRYPNAARSGTDDATYVEDCAGR
jgi:hypothetical protein